MHELASSPRSLLAVALLATTGASHPAPRHAPRHAPLAREARFATAQSPTPPPGLRDKPGKHPAETATYISNIAWGRETTIDARCHVGDSVRDVKLAVTPVLNVRALHPDQAKALGRVVGRIRTVGEPCDDFGLGANDVVYWWMSGRSYGPFGKARVNEFYRIAANGTARETARAAGTYHHKDHEHDPDHGTDRPDAIHIYGLGARAAGDRATFTHNSTWLTCLDGCCHAEGVES